MSSARGVAVIIDKKPDLIGYFPATKSSKQSILAKRTLVYSKWLVVKLQK